MQFLVIARSPDSLDLSALGDRPLLANRYREELVAEGKIVLHAHIAGHRAHMWIYDVDSVDELDQVISDDPMSPFIGGSPEIHPLVSPARMAERADAFERRLQQT
jgi:muconolactone delta-isomerase